MAKNIIKVDGSGRAVALQIIFLKERKHIIAYAPALDLSAFGDSFDEAKTAFEEVVQIFMDDLIERGTLHQVLENLGWAQKDQQWIPPTIISQTFHQIEIPLH